MKNIARISLLFFIVVISVSANAQFSKYIIILKNKTGSPYTISDPSKYLSPRSIQRRIKQKIAIDSTDLPIHPSYLDSIRSTGVTVLNVSKWLNQVCIFTTDANALNKINSFSFVNATQPLKRNYQYLTPHNKFEQPVEPSIINQPKSPTGNYYDYGNSYPQIHIHEGEFLHNAGFHGEGMMLAVIDAGFYHYQTINAFDSIRMHNQIKETYDFVNNKVSVNEENAHGMNCLSIIASNIPGQLVGSCPNASFYLYKSEDDTSEFPVEEQNWAAAAERADSIGVDVLTTSLGYNTFDNPIFNHTYQQLNGTTTIIARANLLASKKGMISIVAAGNEGNSTWHYIDTPADADHILTVGAVSNTGVVASFSSYGPASDGRIKPDVASVGVSTAIAGANNTLTYGNGTSFATPNIAGLTTCLWQAFPDFTNLQIIDAIKKSSSIYTMPDDRIGYGIPNFHTAYNILLTLRITSPNILTNADWIRAYPNPFTNIFKVIIKPKVTGTGNLSIFDATGKLYHHTSVVLVKDEIQTVTFNQSATFAKGVYTIRFDDGSNKVSLRIMKQ